MCSIRRGSIPTRKPAKCSSAPRIASSRPEMPPSPRPEMPESVSILTMKQLRWPTWTGKPLTAVIFMPPPSRLLSRRLRRRSGRAICRHYGERRRLGPCLGDRADRGRIELVLPPLRQQAIRLLDRVSELCVAEANDGRAGEDRADQFGVL